MSQEKNDEISKIMNNPEKVRQIIQAGIKEALLKHKLSGNPVCGSKDGKIYWVKPEDINVHKS